MLACCHRGRIADDRHQILTALYLHLEYGKAVLGVVVGDPFNESVQGFGHEAATSFDFVQERTDISVVIIWGCNTQCLRQVADDFLGDL